MPSVPGSIGTPSGGAPTSGVHLWPALRLLAGLLFDEAERIWWRRGSRCLPRRRRACLAMAGRREARWATSARDGPQSWDITVEADNGPWCRRG
jgi:hypothetical protein